MLKIKQLIAEAILSALPEGAGLSENDVMAEGLLLPLRGFFLPQARRLRFSQERNKQEMKRIYLVIRRSRFPSFRNVRVCIH